MASVYDIIVRPIVTERSMAAVADKKYVFEVAQDAGKIEIKKAVEEIFGVKVAKVNTIHVSGKAKRLGAARPGTTRSWKKAYVQLAADSKTIEFFEGMV
jgi:large subunit ribosomal protein L23